MKNINLFVLFLLILNSCEWSNNTVLNDGLDPYSQIPLIDSIDINSDNESDFVISYSSIQTDDFPSSGGSIIGSITPIGINKILYGENLSYLFLEPNDTISNNDDFNSIWYDYSADLISINRHFNTWDDLWTINSICSSPYYLGIKLVYDNSFEIGYIELDFDTLTGDIIIISSTLTILSQLVIEE